MLLCRRFHFQYINIVFTAPFIYYFHGMIFFFVEQCGVAADLISLHLKSDLNSVDSTNICRYDVIFSFDTLI